MIRLHQSDVFGSVYDLVLSLEECGIRRRARGEVAGVMHSGLPVEKVTIKPTGRTRRPETSKPIPHNPCRSELAREKTEATTVPAGDVDIVIRLRQH